MRFSLLLITLSGIMFAAPVSAFARITYVIVTVDAETPSPSVLGEFPFPEQLHAEVNGEGVGIARMMDIADSYHVPITIFFDVFEQAKFGEATVRAMATEIDARGHDVQLHTHPEWIGDRLYMNEYTLAEQKEIVRQGKILLQSWLGKAPVVHRTGTYAANEDTLEALRENEIFFDSSWYFSNPQASGLESLHFPVNALSERMGVVQFPVSVMRVAEKAFLLRHELPPLYRYKKIDIDSCSLGELKAAFAEIARSELDVVTLFLHSFSFVKKWGKDSTAHKADRDDIEDFSQILDYLTRTPGFAVISSAGFAKRYQAREIQPSGRDFVPAISSEISLAKYLWRKIGLSRQHRGAVAVLGALLVILVFAGVVACFRFRRRKIS